MVLRFLTRSSRKERRVLRAQFRGRRPVAPGADRRRAESPAHRTVGHFPRERDFKP